MLKAYVLHNAERFRINRRNVVSEHILAFISRPIYGLQCRGFCGYPVSSHYLKETESVG